MLVYCMLIFLFGNPYYALHSTVHVWVERLLYSVQCAKYVHKHREFSCAACIVKVNAMLIFVIISPYSSPFVHAFSIKGCCTLCNAQEDIHSVLNEYMALLNNANILDLFIINILNPVNKSALGWKYKLMNVVYYWQAVTFCVTLYKIIPWYTPWHNFGCFTNK